LCDRNSLQGDRLIGDVEFANADIYPFADTIYRLIKGGYLKAVSVGFRPDKWAFSTDRDRPSGIDFKKQTLLEISVCPVPCNPNALGAARSAGIDTRPLTRWAERILDLRDVRAHTSRRQLESLRRLAGPEERLRQARQLKESLGPKTREERMAEAAAIAAEVAPLIETPEDRRRCRMLQASELKRQLRAEGII
jgi:hypothetical protein